MSITSPVAFKSMHLFQIYHSTFLTLRLDPAIDFSFEGSSCYSDVDVMCVTVSNQFYLEIGINFLIPADKSVRFQDHLESKGVP